VTFERWKTAHSLVESACRDVGYAIGYLPQGCELQSELVLLHIDLLRKKEAIEMAGHGAKENH
jgi:hypothetical protein